MRQRQPLLAASRPPRRTKLGTPGATLRPVAAVLLLFVGATSTLGCSSRSLIQPEPDQIAEIAGRHQVTARAPLGEEAAPAPRESARAGNPAAEPPARDVVEHPAGREPQPPAGDNDGENGDTEVGDAVANPPLSEEERSRQREEQFREMIRRGEVPPIPGPSRARDVRVDEDYIYALVNGEVISIKDIRDSVVAYRLELMDAQREAVEQPWRQPITRMLNARERDEIYQSFERQALEVLYRQEARRLLPRFGSIPQQDVDRAIEEAMKRHGIDTDNEEQARRELQRLLSRMGVTYIDFVRQIREQIEFSRVAQYYAFVEEDRFGVTFDVTPQEIVEEYLARPILRTENVRMLRVRFPLLVDTAGERRNQQNRARQFLSELRRRFDRIERQITTAEAREAARQRAFVELAHDYVNDFDDAPVSLPDLSEEPAEVSEEVRRTSAGALSGFVVTSDAIHILYIIEKSQSGYAPVRSPAVQREIRQRIQNRRWNDFRRELDFLLLRRAAIRIREAGAEFTIE